MGMNELGEAIDGARGSEAQRELIPSALNRFIGNERDSQRRIGVHDPNGRSLLQGGRKRDRDPKSARPRKRQRCHSGSPGRGANLEPGTGKFLSEGIPFDRAPVGR